MYIRRCQLCGKERWARRSRLGQTAFCKPCRRRKGMTEGMTRPQPRQKRHKKIAPIPVAPKPATDKKSRKHKIQS